MSVHRVHVVGLGLDHRDLPRVIRSRIDRAEVLVGGTRLLEAFRDHPAVKIPIKSPLDKVIGSIKEEMLSGREVVVLADGDPGFFGIGKRLTESLGAEHVKLYPNVTVLQAAASRIKIPWQDITALSLHGRKDVWPLFRALATNDKVAVLTDKNYHPGRIAEALTARGVDTFRMHVFENLGQEKERVGVFGLSEAKKTRFSPLSLVLLERIKATDIPLHLGLEDDLYLHEKGMITKREIRVVGLSQLEIEPPHTLWDLGAGCGSVAIEGSLLADKGMVLAVEKNDSRIRLIRQNIQRTGAYGVEAVHGEMPECLKSLPDPDRIFVGGGIGHDISVLKDALNRLKPGGKTVLHLVLMGSLERARNFLMEMNWPYTITQVQISRSRSLAGDQRLEALNPVYIISATKPAT